MGQHLEEEIESNNQHYNQNGQAVYYDDIKQQERSRYIFCCCTKVVVGTVACLFILTAIIFVLSYVIALSRFISYENDNASKYTTENEHFIPWLQEQDFSVTVGENDPGYVQLNYNLPPEYSTTNNYVSTMHLCVSNAEGITAYAQPGIPPSPSEYNDILTAFPVPSCSGPVSTIDGISICANATIYVLLESTSATNQTVNLKVFYGNCLSSDCVCGYLIGGLSLAIFFVLLFLGATAIGCCWCCIGFCFCCLLGCIMIFDTSSKNKSENIHLTQHVNYSP